MELSDWLPVCVGRTANNSEYSVFLLNGPYACLLGREYQLNAQFHCNVRSNLTFTSISTHALRSSLCRDVTQPALVVTDVSGQPIAPTFNGGKLLSRLPDDGKKRPKRVVV
jgi:hypothetical protein